MAYLDYKGKHIFYEEKGSGAPLMLLHGDTASSRMFESVVELYADDFRVILIDFLGSGNSDRVEEYPVMKWQEEAKQVIALLEHLCCRDVSLLGTSGGAWVAVNAALERPDLITHVIADCFDGRTLAPDFAEHLVEDRECSKTDELVRQMYMYWLGDDWEDIVDKDTRSLLACAVSGEALFIKPLSELRSSLLLTGSLEDQLVRKDFEQEYDEILKEVPDGRKIMFKTGFHPAVVSQNEAFSKCAIEFLKSC